MAYLEQGLEKGFGEPSERAFEKRDSASEDDVFGNEDHAAIKYKTLSWQLVAFLMICEIVSNGIFSLPYAVATVGIVPAVICIAFLGILATYTSWLLVQFKLRHPQVHTMGDAGYILFGPVGREILCFGTIAFAIFGEGSELVAGAIALQTLSDDRLCALLYTGIIAAAILIISSPRTFDRLGWLSIPSVICITISGLVAMIGAGVHPTPGRVVVATQSTSFYNAFSAITNPVFAYAGHFMFFALISEMKHPEQAMRSAYVLQGFSTIFYIVFAIVTYVYLGSTVGSPSLVSLELKWSKAAFAIGLVNFLIAGALYGHMAAKLVFVRLFRKHKHHLHDHTLLGWGTWIALIVLMNGIAFVLAVGIPVFNYVVGLAASLFASWYTYGIAGMFWIYDAYHDKGLKLWRRDGWTGRTIVHGALSVGTILAGAFICVAGLYVTIRGIVEAYQAGAITTPFAC